jgi:phage terminase small subunit
MTSKKRSFKKVKKFKKPLPASKNSPPPTEEPQTFEEAEQEISSIREAHTKAKYPPPKKHPVFVARWKEYVLDIVLRENFKAGHLAQLGVLCDLFVEYETLADDIRKNGYTYYAKTRNGDQWKQRPEVIQMNRTRAEIRNFSKTLGLLLVKDKEVNGDKDDKEWG